jgi:excinuclease ABC subunit A
VIAEGTPEEVALQERSYTGQFLKEIFAREGREAREARV